jgi:hypothetical protein
VLGQSRQEHVPAFVAGDRWFFMQQGAPRVGRFPAVFLQELRDKTPPQRLVSTSEQSTQPRQGKRLVRRRRNLITIPLPLSAL